MLFRSIPVCSEIRHFYLSICLATILYMISCYLSSAHRYLLRDAVDIATANNTVAIVMANPIAAEMAEEYGITNRKTASILDTFSCVFQGIIPYGAQMLVAVKLGQSVTAFQIIPYLFYPFLLLISTLAFIFIVPEKSKK